MPAGAAPYPISHGAGVPSLTADIPAYDIYLAEVTSTWAREGAEAKSSEGISHFETFAVPAQQLFERSCSRVATGATQSLNDSSLVGWQTPWYA